MAVLACFAEIYCTFRIEIGRSIPNASIVTPHLQPMPRVRTVGTETWPGLCLRRLSLFLRVSFYARDFSMAGEVRQSLTWGLGMFSKGSSVYCADGSGHRVVVWTGDR